MDDPELDLAIANKGEGDSWAQRYIGNPLGFLILATIFGTIFGAVGLGILVGIFWIIKFAWSLA